MKTMHYTYPHIDVLAYVGTALLMLAPYMGNRMEYFIILGFLAMTPQAWQRGIWNLVALNLFGAFSYTWRIFYV